MGEINGSKTVVKAVKPPDILSHDQQKIKVSVFNKVLIAWFSVKNNFTFKLHQKILEDPIFMSAMQ